MSDLLQMFGFCWMGVAAHLGLFVGVKHPKFGAKLDALAKAGNLAEYHREQTEFRHKVTVHAHTFLFSVVCLFVAAALPRLALPPYMIDLTAIGMMVAPVLWTVAALAQIRMLMGLADGVFLGSVMNTAVGLVKAYYFS